MHRCTHQLRAYRTRCNHATYPQMVQASKSGTRRQPPTRQPEWPTPQKPVTMFYLLIPWYFSSYIHAVENEPGQVPDKHHDQCPPGRCVHNWLALIYASNDDLHNIFHIGETAALLL